MHKEKQAILVDDNSQEEKTSKTTNEMQELAKDPVTGATRTKRSSQKLVQQWVKKEDCLKGDDDVSTSSARLQEPQEQAKLQTQVAEDNEETYVPHLQEST